MENPQVMLKADKKVRNEIEQAEERFVRWSNEGDVDQILDAFYTKDVRLLAPETPAAEGRENVRQVFQDLQETYESVDLELHDVWQAGDLAVAQGAYRGTLRFTGDTVTGTYVEVYRRTPEGWRCFLDTFNGDAPA